MRKLVHIDWFIINRLWKYLFTILHEIVALVFHTEHLIGLCQCPVFNFLPQLLCSSFLCKSTYLVHKRRGQCPFSQKALVCSFWIVNQIKTCKYDYMEGNDLCVFKGVCPGLYVQWFDVRDGCSSGVPLHFLWTNYSNGN